MKTDKLVIEFEGAKTEFTRTCFERNVTWRCEHFVLNCRDYRRDEPIEIHGGITDESMLNLQDDSFVDIFLGLEGAFEATTWMVIGLRGK